MGFPTRVAIGFAYGRVTLAAAYVLRGWMP